MVMVVSVGANIFGDDEPDREVWILADDPDANDPRNDANSTNNGTVPDNSTDPFNTTDPFNSTTEEPDVSTMAPTTTPEGTLAPTNAPLVVAPKPTHVPIVQRESAEDSDEDDGSLLMIIAISVAGGAMLSLCALAGFLILTRKKQGAIETTARAQKTSMEQYITDTNNNIERIKSDLHKPDKQHAEDARRNQETLEQFKRKQAADKERADAEVRQVCG